MSPIGRVFIVLNLLLAGTFVGFAGTYLQQANHWKTEHGKKSEELAKEHSEHMADRKSSEEQINKQQNEKVTLDNSLNNMKVTNQHLEEDNARYQKQLASIEADVKGLMASAAAQRAENQTAFENARKSYDMAMADQKTKDAAVREKDDATAKLRDANFKIQGLEENLKDREVKIAGLNKDLSETRLLVDVARQKGFRVDMATPPLAGTVSNVNTGGKLVTISITQNSTNADVKPGYSFAIYEGNTYKGEARVTEAADGMAFCTVDKLKDGATIKVGDKASTQTN